MADYARNRYLQQAEYDYNTERLDLEDIYKKKCVRLELEVAELRKERE